jgi:hypothetical protein
MSLFFWRDALAVQPPPAPAMFPCCAVVGECCLLLGVGVAEVVQLAAVLDPRSPPPPAICTHAPSGHRANIDLVLDSQQQHRETAAPGAITWTDASTLYCFPLSAGLSAQSPYCMLAPRHRGIKGPGTPGGGVKLAVCSAGSEGIRGI